MQISLKNIPIHPSLKEHIGKLWVFESSGRIPDMDMKLVVPNGMIKLVIPFKEYFWPDQHQRTGKKNRL